MKSQNQTDLLLCRSSSLLTRGTTRSQTWCSGHNKLICVKVVQIFTPEHFHQTENRQSSLTVWYVRTDVLVSDNQDWLLFICDFCVSGSSCMVIGSNINVILYMSIADLKGQSFYRIIKWLLITNRWCKESGGLWFYPRNKGRKTTHNLWTVNLCLIF